MSQITGNGAPSRNTKGAINDIYKDLDTGSVYICKSISLDSFGNKEYDWYFDHEEVTDGFDEEIVEEVIDIPETVTEDLEYLDLEEEKVEEPKGDEKAPNRSNNNYRKPYNKHYKPNKN